MSNPDVLPDGCYRVRVLATSPYTFYEVLGGRFDGTRERHREPTPAPIEPFSCYDVTIDGNVIRFLAPGTLEEVE